MVTCPDNTHSIDLGWFTVQPDPAGMVRIEFSKPYTTWGVAIVADEQCHILEMSLE